MSTPALVGMAVNVDGNPPADVPPVVQEITQSATFASSGGLADALLSALVAFGMPFVPELQPADVDRSFK
jgi:hypothetical protein